MYNVSTFLDSSWQEKTGKDGKILILFDFVSDNSSGKHECSGDNTERAVLSYKLAYNINFKCTA